MLYSSRYITYAHHSVCVNSTWFVRVVLNVLTPILSDWIPLNAHMDLINLNKVTVGTRGGEGFISLRLKEDRSCWTEPQMKHKHAKSLITASSVTMEDMLSCKNYE